MTEASPPEGSVPLDKLYLETTFKNWDKMEFDKNSLGPGFFKIFKIVPALIHNPGGISRMMLQGDISTVIFALLVLSFCSLALYGAIIGFFGGGHQIFFAALKFPLAILGSLFICLPTFYVFNSLAGSLLNFSQIMLSLFVLSGFMSVFLIGFAPVVWFFTISTGTAVFMTLFHMVVILLSFIFASRYFRLMFSYIQYKAGREHSADDKFLTLWQIIFVFVSCQMAYYLKPLMGDGPFYTGERGIFFEFFSNMISRG